MDFLLREFPEAVSEGIRQEEHLSRELLMRLIYLSGRWGQESGQLTKR